MRRRDIDRMVDAMRSGQPECGRCYEAATCVENLLATIAEGGDAVAKARDLLDDAAAMVIRQWTQIRELAAALGDDHPLTRKLRDAGEIP